MSDERIVPDKLPVEYNVTRDLLEFNIENGRAEKAAIRYGRDTIRYGQLLREVNRTGNFLRKDLGAGLETRVALLVFDGPEFVSSFLAAMRIGAVAVPLSTMLTPEDYIYLLNDTRAPVLILDKSLLGGILSVAPSLEYLRHLVVVGASADETDQLTRGTNLHAVSYRDAVVTQPEYLDVARTNKDDSAFWQYSSGSTGRPKGTIHLHHDIYYAAYYLNRHFYHISSSDLVYSASKMFFSYGLGNSLWIPFFSGASVVLESQRSNPAVMTSNIAEFRPTKVFAVPSLYKALCEFLSGDPKLVEPYRSVERYYSAGEPLSKGLYEKWLELTGSEILTVLGSTEAIQGYTGCWPGMGCPGSLGRPIPGYEAKIVDQEGNAVPRGEKGVLMIRGDSVAPGYWNRHRESQNTFRGEWLYTGDIVYEDADGILWYVGRDDDMFKISGMWVSPMEVEETLRLHPSVQECAVVGVVDDRDVTTMRAYVVRAGSDGSEADAEAALRDFVKSRLPSYKCPRMIYFLRELPHNSVGKVQRFKLRQLQQGS